MVRDAAVDRHDRLAWIGESHFIVMGYFSIVVNTADFLSVSVRRTVADIVPIRVKKVVLRNPRTAVNRAWKGISVRGALHGHHDNFLACRISHGRRLERDRGMRTAMYRTSEAGQEINRGGIQPSFGPNTLPRTPSLLQVK